MKNLGSALESSNFRERSEREMGLAFWWRMSEMGGEIRISSFCSKVWLENECKRTMID